MQKVLVQTFHLVQQLSPDSPCVVHAPPRVVGESRRCCCVLVGELLACVPQASLFTQKYVCWQEQIIVEYTSFIKTNRCLCSPYCFSQRYAGLNKDGVSARIILHLLSIKNHVSLWSCTSWMKDLLPWSVSQRSSLLTLLLCQLMCVWMCVKSETQSLHSPAVSSKQTRVWVIKLVNSVSNINPKGTTSYFYWIFF